MKLIHAAKHAMEAHLVKGFLESRGIDAVVRGEYLTSGWGELPIDVCSVWITDEARFDHANQLLIAFLKGTFAREAGVTNWQCPECNEILEGQFTACWNCGAAKPADA